MKLHTELMFISVLGLAGMTGCAAAVAADASNGIVDRVLLSRSLQVAQGKDVMVDRVTLPPYTELPRRWHPGEMFAYVMEGRVIVSLEGEAEVVAGKGELVEVPFRKVYSARTTEQGAQLLIFRVHEGGQPVRVIVQ